MLTVLSRLLAWNIKVLTSIVNRRVISVARIQQFMTRCVYIAVCLRQSNYSPMTPDNSQITSILIRNTVLNIYLAAVGNGPYDPICV